MPTRVALLKCTLQYETLLNRYDLTVPEGGAKKYEKASLAVADVIFKVSKEEENLREVRSIIITLDSADACSASSFFVTAFDAAKSRRLEV